MVGLASEQSSGVVALLDECGKMSHNVIIPSHFYCLLFVTLVHRSISSTIVVQPCDNVGGVQHAMQVIYIRNNFIQVPLCLCEGQRVSHDRGKISPRLLPTARRARSSLSSTPSATLDNNTVFITSQALHPS